MKKQTEYKFDIFTDGLTQSQIMNYVSCKRYFYLSLIRGWAEAELSPAIVLGILFHTCLELYYEGADPDGLPNSVLADYEEAEDFDSWSLERRQKWVDIAARLEAIFPAYVDYWAKRDKGYDWESLEELFNIPLPVTLRNNKKVEIPIRGMYDGRLALSKKRKLVMDHKSKGRVNHGGIANTLLFDFQMNLYLWAANSRYGGYHGFVYNLIHTSNLRINKDNDGPELQRRITAAIRKNPADYFSRVEKTVSVKQQKAFVAHLFEIVTEIANFTLLGGDTENRFTSPCLGPYGQCSLLGICHNGDSTGLARRKHPHPELVRKE